MKLWRPVGLHELGLIYDNEMRAFPARLPQQPIFYPVLNPEYASQIASSWNTTRDPHAGYVVAFDVPDEVVAKYPMHQVGGSVHKELWVPAEDLDAVNRVIMGSIVAESAYFGKEFHGYVPDQSGLRGKSAVEQVQAMAETLSHSTFDFAMEIAANHKAVFLNFPYWKAAGPEELGLHPAAFDSCLGRMRSIWNDHPRAGALLENATLVP